MLLIDCEEDFENRFSMVRKMQINRLSQDELSYELQIRGIATGTVEEMRHALVMAIRLEKSGDSVKLPTYPFSEDEDVKAVDTKLKDLEPQISSFKETSSSGNFYKFQSKLSHVLNRIDNIPESSPDRPQLLSRALTLMNQLLQKAEDVESELAVPVQICSLGSNQAQRNFAASIHPSRASSPVRPSPITQTNFKSVPPSKWNLIFSGDKKGISLSAFLERVEELRVARHVAKETLLESGIDLFSGRAYQFYLAYRNQVSTWDEFVVLLREEYLTPNYNEKLFDEIRKRTQGPDETIGIYLAVMTGYFNRLSCPVPEETKLKIIMRNLAPFYQNHLALVEVNSILELRQLGKRLEARKEAVESFVPPCKRSSAMEPDLAYVQVSEEGSSVDSCQMPTTVRQQNQSVSKEILCYRCNRPGHRAVGCSLNRGKFCFRCKKEGYTLKTCPDCSRSGN